MKRSVFLPFSERYKCKLFSNCSCAGNRNKWFSLNTQQNPFKVNGRLLAIMDVRIFRYSNFEQCFSCWSGLKTFYEGYVSFYEGYASFYEGYASFYEGYVSCYEGYVSTRQHDIIFLVFLYRCVCEEFFFTNASHTRSRTSPYSV